MIRDAQKLEETLIWSNYNRPTAERTFYVSAHARKLFVHWVNLIWHKKWDGINFVKSYAKAGTSLCP